MNDKIEGTEVQATKSARVARPCACSFIEVILPAGTVLQSQAAKNLVSETGEDGMVLRTECDERSFRTFAPGHDARTVALLQAAARTEGSVVLVGGNEHDLDEVLSAFPGLADKVTAPAPTRTSRGAGPVVTSDEPPAALASLLS